MAAPSTVETDTATHPAHVGGAESAADLDALVEDEILVEEISIDGMCGVY